LSYIVNEDNWGVAFKDEELKKGTLLPAVASIYMDDTFTLNMIIQED